MKQNKKDIELLETIEIPVKELKKYIDIPKEEIELLETIEIPIEEIKKKNSSDIELLETIKIPVNEIASELKKLPSNTINNEHIEIPSHTIRQIFKKVKNKYLFIGSKKICKKIWLLVFIISISIITILTIILINWNNDNNRIKKEINKIENNVIVEEIKLEKEPTPSTTPTTSPAPSSNNNTSESNPYWDFMKTSFINVNLTKLKQDNSDTIGWIKVNNTNINYPFVQTVDNDYYLTHSFYKNKNSAGWVFLDYRNNFETLDKNNILYAHGRLNNTMFGSLKKVIEPYWYQNEDNHYIKISSIYSNTIWKVFSVYTIEPESYYLKTKFNTDEDFTNFYQELKNRSITNFNTDISKDDKILTLSSCYNDKLRVVLHAKLVSIQ